MSTMPSNGLSIYANQNGSHSESTNLEEYLMPCMNMAGHTGSEQLKKFIMLVGDI